MSDPRDHEFLPVTGHEDDDECTYREDGTDATYCGAPEDEHWVDPEECPACDTPLDECPFPVAGCCPDCNHSLNYDSERTPPADVEVGRHDADARRALRPTRQQMTRLVVTMPDALFDLDDYAPLAVKVMRCASCIGQGCARCDTTGRLGSSIWRGTSCLARITAAVEIGSQ